MRVYLLKRDLQIEVPVKFMVYYKFPNSLTGCDQVSSVASKGKTTAWDTWTSFGKIHLFLQHYVHVEHHHLFFFFSFFLCGVFNKSVLQFIKRTDDQSAFVSNIFE